MLYLISLGLFELEDMSLKAINIAKSCDKLYLENYTNYFKDIAKLPRFLNKEVIILDRNGIENNSSLLIKEAKDKKIGILIGGDCLTATTHISLLIDAKKAGVKTEIIHGSSIFTAIAETGLMLYNFGKIASIPFDTKNVKAPIEVLEMNKKNHLHTLFLLDLDLKNNKFLSANEALKYLLDNKIDELCIVCSQLGKDSEIKKGKISELAKEKFTRYPQCIIIPGKLHFIEEEYLNLL